MLQIPPAEFRKRPARSKRGAAKPPAPPAALTLVAAEYDDASPWVRLTFDRPINIGAIVADQVVVDDGPITGTLWQGTEASLIAPATVVLGLEAVEPTFNTDTFLRATDATGIVAADDPPRVGRGPASSICCCRTPHDEPRMNTDTRR